MTLRVLHVIDNLAAGGSQRVLSTLVHGGKQRGIVYHVAVLQGRDEFSPVMEQVVPVTHLGYAKYNPLVLRGVIRQIEMFKPDIVQTMLLKSCLIGVYLSVFTRQKVILAPRGVMSAEAHEGVFPSAWAARLYVAAFPRWARWARAVVAQTGADGQVYRRAGVMTEKLMVIPNGLDITKYQMSETECAEKRAAFRAGCGLPQDALLVTQIARLSPEKNPLMLLHAFALVAAEFPQAHLCLVGTGSEQAAVEAWRVQLGLTERVHLLGHRDDIPAVLAGSDILTLSSSSDAFPNVILEAWAARLPVVATMCTGPLEMIEDGRDGLLVPINDPVQMGEALRRLMLSPELRYDLGLTGYRKLVERYTAEKMRQSYEDLYRRIG